MRNPIFEKQILYIYIYIWKNSSGACTIRTYYYICIHFALNMQHDIRNTYVCTHDCLRYAFLGPSGLVVWQLLEADFGDGLKHFA